MPRHPRTGTGASPIQPGLGFELLEQIHFTPADQRLHVRLHANQHQQADTLQPASGDTHLHAPMRVAFRIRERLVRADFQPTRFDRLLIRCQQFMLPVFLPVTPVVRDQPFRQPVRTGLDSGRAVEDFRRGLQIVGAGWAGEVMERGFGEFSRAVRSSLTLLARAMTMSGLSTSRSSDAVVL